MRELLKKISDNNILLEVVDGQLKVFARDADLPQDVIQGIREKKKELIELLLHKQHTPRSGFPIEIPNVPIQNDYSLSPSQRRLWILSQLDGSNSAYNLWGAYVFSGQLDLEALELSLRALIARHESLRTAFIEDQHGEIRQRIIAEQDANFQVAFRDVRSADDRSLASMVQAEIAKPFDLRHAPLLRVTLFQQRQGDWVFTYVMHHIVSDAWSMRILMKELLATYNAKVTGDTLALKSLRIQYKDFTIWQESHSKTDAFREHRSYWLHQFEGEIPVLKLVGDRPRPISKTYNGASISKRFESEVSHQLKGLAQQHGSTMFMTLLALVKSLLYRYTGQEDIVIGTSIASRPHADLEDQIGFYVNTLALRTRFSGDEDFTRLVSRVKATTLEAYEHQAYPFDELVEALHIERDVSRSSLFDVMVVYQNEGEATSSSQQLEGLQVTSYEQATEVISKFDITFFFTEVNNAIHLNLVYNTDIFSNATMDRLSIHLQRFMLAILSQPSLPIHALDYLEDAEKRTLIFDYGSSSTTAYPKHQTVVGLIEDQAKRTPDYVAVACETRTLTYAQLNEKSNLLASYLWEQCGVRAGDAVGIMLDRSESIIIALLGIMKCGAAYVALEPDMPQKRKEYMIEDTRIKALVTQADYLYDLSFFAGNLFVIDIQLETIETSPTFSLPPISTTGLAYIVYTSGSTGRPKGVMITHGALMDYVHGILEKTNIRECKTFGLVSTLASDLGNTVLYPSLVTGGTLHVFSTTDVMTPSKMIGAALECVKIVPSHWRALQLGQQLFAPKKCLIFGGEVLSYDIIAQLKTATCQVYNHYGPSETTVGKLLKPVAPTETGERVPLGRPFGNTQVYIMDAHRQLVPRGVVGEICIGGDGLAMGYLHQHELTREKFITDPFNAHQLIYTTGDLGRWLSDGTVEFLGRKDDQIKIRGYRLELGEIESALKAHPAVSTAAVLCKDLDNNDKRLQAYVTVLTPIDESTLRTFLAERLPAYMLPYQILVLGTIPLTANGKVDRKKLLALAHDENTTHAVLNPRNETEERLLVIWKEVLGTSELGVTDNFFDRGGNSLKIVKMVWLIERAFGKKISVVMAFKFYNVESLAAYIDSYDDDISEEGHDMIESIAQMENTLNLLNENTNEE